MSAAGLSRQFAARIRAVDKLLPVQASLPLRIAALRLVVPAEAKLTPARPRRMAKAAPRLSQEYRHKQQRRPIFNGSRPLFVLIDEMCNAKGQSL
jgi:hypothetical protein